MCLTQPEMPSAPGAALGAVAQGRCEHRSRGAEGGTSHLLLPTSCLCVVHCRKLNNTGSKIYPFLLNSSPVECHWVLAGKTPSTVPCEILCYHMV